MTTAVKRACDACHRRKVRCDGVNPCRNCNLATLNCTYNAVPQKKGPKGSRAKVISSLRECQKQNSLVTQVQNRLNGTPGPPTTPSLAPTPGLLSLDMIRECLDFFFLNMYPHMPILSRSRIEQQIAYMDQNLDAYCTLTSLCALTMLQPGMCIPDLDSMPGAAIVCSTLLVEETNRVRRGFDYTESPSLNTLCTSYLLFACHYGLDMHDRAWFHLREAATMIHIAGMNREDAYAQFDPVDSSRRRRLYWLLFVAERAYALQRNRPLTLQATVNLPTLADDPTDPYAHDLNSFFLLVNLLRPFDDAFVATWNKSRSNWPAAHLHTLQKQLADILPSFLNYGDSQLADLRTNQQWIKTMIWQVSMNKANVDESMVYQQYAANLTASLLPGVQDAESPATPFLTELLEVACALTEVLALYPASRDPFSPGPHEQLNPLLNVLSMLRNGDHRFMPLLVSKMHEVLPKLANPMLQNVPDNLANNICNVDIFDGFGNAGMAQPPVMMDSFEKKYTSPDSSSSQGGPPSSTNEMHSPFVSSPMSPPSADFTNGLPNTSFNPMSEVIMNPMGQPQTLGTPTNTSNPPATPHSQHQPATSITSLPIMNPHLQNGMNAPLDQPANLNMNHQNQNFGQPFNQNMSYAMNPLGQNMNANNMMHRQTPNRATSFAMSQNPQMRTIGEFQTLQRTNSDISAMNSMGGMNNGLGPVGNDMDFSVLR